MSTAYSSLFNSTTTWPIAGYPQRQPYGETVVTVTKTIPTTQLDTIADVTHMVPIDSGTTINLLVFTSADFDSSTGLDADIVLIDDNGTTILYNAGTAFQAAMTNQVILCNVDVLAVNGDAKISFLVNSVATTPVAGDLTLQVRYSGASF